MSTKTKIEWADRVWNPVTGCTKVSQGCKNCYAERVTHRFKEKMGDFSVVKFHPDRLLIPSGWKKPQRIFVNSMSDLFHEDVPFEFIDDVLRAAIFTNHTFMILTKRPKRVLEFLGWRKQQFGSAWHMSNIWIGVSVEDQETANERIPILLKIPAKIRFLSCEPLIGAIDLNKIAFKDFMPSLIHWVIVGGESGPKARPMHPLWLRSLRDQCAVADVPFFFKQWGEWMEGAFAATLSKVAMVTIDGKVITEGEIPERKKAYLMSRVGKKSAGNVLDGRVHFEFPKTEQL